jgi:DNA polymerase
MKLEDLNIEYDKLQKRYGAKELHSIYNGGCIDNPDICFVFMNPTGRNIATDPSWKGPRSPWIGTKNIWTLFSKINLIDEDIYEEIRNKKGSEWTPDFAIKVYDNIKKHKVFITNLGKCTQVDARPLPDSVLQKYLKHLEKEIEIINPKVIILFGNQVSSIVLKEKISVSSSRKKEYIKKIKKQEYKCYPVYYPIGNGIFNIDKSIEDINWIKDNIL